MRSKIPGAKFRGCGFYQIHSGRKLCRGEKDALTGTEEHSGVTVSNSFPSQFFKVAVLVNGLTVFVGLRSLNWDRPLANRAQQRWRLRPESARPKKRKSEWHTSTPPRRANRTSGVPGNGPADRRGPSIQFSKAQPFDPELGESPFIKVTKSECGKYFSGCW